MWFLGAETLFTRAVDASVVPFDASPKTAQATTKQKFDLFLALRTPFCFAHVKSQKQNEITLPHSQYHSTATQKNNNFFIVVDVEFAVLRI